MLRIVSAADDEQARVELAKMLHPSSGLPWRLRVVPDGGEPEGGGGDEPAFLAEITRIEALPGFLSSRSS